MTHTSGLQDFPTDITVYTNNQDAPLTPHQIIALFRDKPLRFQPGERFGYSSPGYILLGYIIERVSGQPYGTFLRKRIFEPLKMVKTGYDCPESDLAKGYQSFGVRARLLQWPIAYSVCTMVEDLYLWDQALDTEQLVSKELLDAMFTPYVSAPSYDGRYGYGWFIGEKLGRRVVGHGGWIPGRGFRSFIERYPNERVTTVILSNQENVDVATMAMVIDQLVFSMK